VNITGRVSLKLGLSSILSSYAFNSEYSSFQGGNDAAAGSE
jgi:hypothetical protein